MANAFQKLGFERVQWETENEMGVEQLKYVG